MLVHVPANALEAHRWRPCEARLTSGAALGWAATPIRFDIVCGFASAAAPIYPERLANLTRLARTYKCTPTGGPRRKIGRRF
jgi:hypothetical protein